MITENEVVTILSATSGSIDAIDIALHNLGSAIITTRTKLLQRKDNVLTALSGWKDYVGVELTTVPKLNGDGSYIESKHLAEREISVSVSVLGDSERGTEAISDKLLTHMFQWKPIRVYRVLLDENASGVTNVRRIESMEGYITGLSEWTQSGEHAHMTFSLRILNPRKKWENYDKYNNKLSEGYQL